MIKRAAYWAALFYFYFMLLWRGFLMKDDSKKIKWMIIGLIFLVILSVTITIIVIAKMTAQPVSELPWENETQAEDPDREILLNNIYITDSGADKVTFIYYGESYTLDGHVEEPYEGVADILIQKDEIKKIYAKRTIISGVLNSYSDGDVEVAGYGLIPRVKEWHVYSFANDEVSEMDISDLIIGTSKLSYVVANGEICAILMDQETKAEVIRVLIKNGSEVIYPKLYITGEQNWTINGMEQSAMVPVEMNSLIQNMEWVDATENEGSPVSASQVKTAYIKCDGGQLFITNEKGEQIKAGYEGDFQVRQVPGGVVLINVVDIENYVRYVLPSEMPVTFSYEALKAQAVCARTFAYSQMKNATYAMYGANLDDTTSYQVYNNAGTKEITDLAARETSGQVIAHNDELITCYYYSTSPGVTENFEVWGDENPEYIKSACTLLENKNLGRGIDSEKKFREYISSEPLSYDDESPFYRWTATVDLSQEESESFGRLKNLVISNRGEYGYITALTFVYDHGTMQITDEYEMRQYLGKYLIGLQLNDGSSRENFPLIPSACFTIEASENGIYIIHGGGYGHGIGLSQYAASAMGNDGMTYDEIISFFYNDVNIITK